MYEKAATLLVITIIILILSYERPTESINQTTQTGVAQRIESKVLKPDKRLIGTFKITYYNGRGGIEGGSNNCLGEPLKEGMIATDPDIIPTGSKVIIDGQEYTACDVGGMINGKHIDMYKDVSGNELKRLGIDYCKVWISVHK